MGNKQFTVNLKNINFNRIYAQVERARYGSKAIFRQGRRPGQRAAAMGDTQQRFHKALVQLLGGYNVRTSMAVVY
jgi:hypothetical protein